MMKDGQPEEDHSPPFSGFLQILIYLALIIIIGSAVKGIVPWAIP